MKLLLILPKAFGLLRRKYRGKRMTSSTWWHTIQQSLDARYVNGRKRNQPLTAQVGWPPIGRSTLPTVLAYLLISKSLQISIQLQLSRTKEIYWW